MPHLIHHKRRHSWPYCGSGMHLRERRNLPMITVMETSDQLELQFLAPIFSEDLLVDDAASAGIIRSKPPRPQRRLWPSSKEETGEAQRQVSVEFESGSVSLRQIIQPPLDRARSLFILPTTVSPGEVMMVPHWIQRLAAHPIRHSGRRRPVGDERGRMAVERNHRRCHSERPRSWKEPSVNLWTLQEE